MKFSRSLTNSRHYFQTFDDSGRLLDLIAYFFSSEITKVSSSLIGGIQFK